MCSVSLYDLCAMHAQYSPTAATARHLPQYMQRIFFWYPSVHSLHNALTSWHALSLTIKGLMGQHSVTNSQTHRPVEI
jgi:hypothetical protein